MGLHQQRFSGSISITLSTTHPVRILLVYASCLLMLSPAPNAFIPSCLDSSCLFLQDAALADNPGWVWSPPLMPCADLSHREGVCAFPVTCELLGKGTMPLINLHSPKHDVWQTILTIWYEMSIILPNQWMKKWKFEGYLRPACRLPN